MKDVEQQVCEDILSRQQIGIRKYGTTVAGSDLPLRDWLEHAYQECLDQAIYLRRAIEGLNSTAVTGEWITDRPPTEDEVADGSDCWVTRYSGEVSICDGKWVRTYWQQQEKHDPRCWMPVTKPEPYQPPKPKRAEMWLGYEHVGDGNGGLRRDFNCGFYYSEPTAVESLHVREVLPGDIDPDAAIALREAAREVAAELRKWLDYAQDNRFSTLKVGHGTLTEWNDKLHAHTGGDK